MSTFGATIPKPLQSCNWKYGAPKTLSEEAEIEDAVKYYFHNSPFLQGCGVAHAVIRSTFHTRPPFTYDWVTVDFQAYDGTHITTHHVPRKHPVLGKSQSRSDLSDSWRSSRPKARRKEVSDVEGWSIWKRQKPSKHVKRHSLCI